MFCAICGNQLKDEGKFCPKCGTPVDESAAASAKSSSNEASPTQGTMPNTVPPKPAEKNYYEILELTRDASSTEIQDAIKKQRTLWSSRVPRGGSMGERARQMVEMIGLAEATLLDEKKRAEYDESLSEKKDYQVIIPEGEKNWLEVLYSYYDQQDWDMAAQAAQKATKQQSYNPEAWFLAANVYINLKDYNKANAAAQQVLLLDPENPTAYGIRGDVLLINKNNARQAIVMYEKMKERAKDSETRKLAEECIITAKATTINARLDSIIHSIPNEFEYSKGIMDLLNNNLSKVDNVRKELENLYSQATNPSSWIESVKSGDLGDCDTVKSEIQRLINEGNEKVHLPGFWLTIVLWVVGGFISFACMGSSIGAGFILLIIISIAMYIRGFVIQTKPRWKVGSAWLYKYMR